MKDSPKGNGLFNPAMGFTHPKGIADLTYHASSQKVLVRLMRFAPVVIKPHSHPRDVDALIMEG